MRIINESVSSALNMDNRAYFAQFAHKPHLMGPLRSADQGPLIRS